MNLKHALAQLIRLARQHGPRSQQVRHFVRTTRAGDDWPKLAAGTLLILCG